MPIGIRLPTAVPLSQEEAERHALRQIPPEFPLRVEELKGLFEALPNPYAFEKFVAIAHEAPHGGGLSRAVTFRSVAFSSPSGDKKVWVLE